ncbi:MAG: hypothetical protein KDA60_20170 [Planctomycetales bacterium]|nr:hypothetical protein [Planctomycetales bacterium]
MISVSFARWCLLLALVPWTLGCQPATETTSTSTSVSSSDHGHDHADDDGHDHSEGGAGHGHDTDFVGAVKIMQECRDEIKAAFDAGKPDECDSYVHLGAKRAKELAHLAEDGGCSTEQVSAVETSARQVFDCLEKIHVGFHDDGEGAAFADVAESMDNALADLQAIADAVGQATYDK